jgi:thiol-disulfide isomerase/thioredoxin
LESDMSSEMRVSVTRWLFGSWMLLVVASAAVAEDSGTTALRLTGPDGVAVEFDEPTIGEALLLHFWASWCPSCRLDLAHLQHVASTCEGHNVRVYVVNVGETREIAENFLSTHEIELPLLLDDAGAVWKLLAGRGLPINLFWKPGDRRVTAGAFDADRWRVELERLGCVGADAPSGGSDSLRDDATH